MEKKSWEQRFLKLLARSTDLFLGGMPPAVGTGRRALVG